MAVNNQYPVTALDKSKLKVRSKNWPETNRAATLEISAVNNNVWMKIWLNHPTVQTKGPVIAKFGLNEFAIFTEYLKDCAEKDHNAGAKFTNFTAGERVEGQPLKREVQSFIKVGRDEKGILFIGVAVPEMPKVVFPLTISYWFGIDDIEDANKERIFSNLAVRGWVKNIEQMLYYTLTNNHVDEKALAELRKQRMQERQQQKTAADINNDIGSAMASELTFD